jgi:hypothetical protein
VSESHLFQINNLLTSRCEFFLKMTENPLNVKNLFLIVPTSPTAYRIPTDVFQQLGFLWFYRNTDLFYSCKVAYAAAAYVFSNTFDSYASSKYKRVRSLIITTSPYTESPTDVFQQLGFFEIPTYFIVATSHTLLLLLIYFQHLGFLWDSYASSKSRTGCEFSSS